MAPQAPRSQSRSNTTSNMRYKSITTPSPALRSIHDLSKPTVKNGNTKKGKVKSNTRKKGTIATNTTNTTTSRDRGKGSVRSVSSPEINDEMSVLLDIYSLPSTTPAACTPLGTSQSVKSSPKMEVPSLPVQSYTPNTHRDNNNNNIPTVKRKMQTPMSPFPKNNHSTQCRTNTLNSSSDRSLRVGSKRSTSVTGTPTPVLGKNNNNNVVSSSIQTPRTIKIKRHQKGGDHDDINSSSQRHCISVSREGGKINKNTGYDTDNTVDEDFDITTTSHCFNSNTIAVKHREGRNINSVLSCSSGGVNAAECDIYQQEEIEDSHQASHNNNGTQASQPLLYSPHGEHYSSSQHNTIEVTHQFPTATSETITRDEKSDKPEINEDVNIVIKSNENQPIYAAQREIGMYDDNNINQSKDLEITQLTDEGDISQLEMVARKDDMIFPSDNNNNNNNNKLLSQSHGSTIVGKTGEYTTGSREDNLEGAINNINNRKTVFHEIGGPIMLISSDQRERAARMTALLDISGTSKVYNKTAIDQEDVTPLHVQLARLDEPQTAVQRHLILVGNDTADVNNGGDGFHHGSVIHSTLESSPNIPLFRSDDEEEEEDLSPNFRRPVGRKEYGDNNNNNNNNNNNISNEFFIPSQDANGIPLHSSILSRGTTLKSETQSRGQVGVNADNNNDVIVSQGMHHILSQVAGAHLSVSNRRSTSRISRVAHNYHNSNNSNNMNTVNIVNNVLNDIHGDDEGSTISTIISASQLQRQAGEKWTRSACEFFDYINKLPPLKVIELPPVNNLKANVNVRRKRNLKSKLQ